MIVAGVIGLLAAISIPNYVKARATAQQNTCIANLRAVRGAIDQWAIEKKKSTSDTVDATLFEYIKGGKMPICPAGGVIDVTTVGDNPTCTKSTLVGSPHELPN
jgi:type II secretory pathway pseudopilin PulG